MNESDAHRRDDELEAELEAELERREAAWTEDLPGPDSGDQTG